MKLGLHIGYWGLGLTKDEQLELVREAERLLADPEEARRRGLIAREAALERYGLRRFLADWDETLGETVRRTLPNLGGTQVGIAPEQRNLGEVP